jgi:hypothetical protein
LLSLRFLVTRLYLFLYIHYVSRKCASVYPGAGIVATPLASLPGPFNTLYLSQTSILFRPMFALVFAANLGFSAQPHKFSLPLGKIRLAQKRRKLSREIASAPSYLVCQLPLASTLHPAGSLCLEPLSPSKCCFAHSPAISIHRDPCVPLTWAADSETVTSESAVLLQLVSQVSLSLPSMSRSPPEDPSLSLLIEYLLSLNSFTHLDKLGSMARLYPDPWTRCPPA